MRYLVSLIVVLALIALVAGCITANGILLGLSIAGSFIALWLEPYA